MNRSISFRTWKSLSSTNYLLSLAVPSKYLTTYRGHTCVFQKSREMSQTVFTREKEICLSVYNHCTTCWPKKQPRLSIQMLQYIPQTANRQTNKYIKPFSRKKKKLTKCKKKKLFLSTIRTIFGRNRQKIWCCNTKQTHFLYNINNNCI